MKINKATLIKLEKVKKAIEEGQTLTEIAGNYFSRSQKKRADFFEKHGLKEGSQIENIDKKLKDIRPEKEEVILENNIVTPPANVISNDFNLNFLPEDIQILLMNSERVLNAVEKIEKLESNNLVEDEINILIIDDEYVGMKDNKYKTRGLSESIENKLKLVAKKYPQYKIVTIMNYILDKELDKYLD